jgi:hypothetical protein
VVAGITGKLVQHNQVVRRSIAYVELAAEYVEVDGH